MGRIARPACSRLFWAASAPDEATRSGRSVTEECCRSDFSDAAIVAEGTEKMQVLSSFLCSNTSGMSLSFVLWNVTAYRCGDREMFLSVTTRVAKIVCKLMALLEASRLVAIKHLTSTVDNYYLL